MEIRNLKYKAIATFLKAGINVFPVKEDKTPDLTNFASWQRLWSFKDFPEEDKIQGIAIAAGRYSDGIFCVDVDTKYDLTGTLYEDLRDALIKAIGQEAWDSLVIQETKSGGYHLVLKTRLQLGNLKLANRPTTDEEKAIDPKAKKRCLIETRGEGGYFLTYPSPGYKLLQGRYTKLKFLPDEVVQSILQVCRSFNTYKEEEKKSVYSRKEQAARGNAKAPWTDYNERGDVVSLLMGYGWEFVEQKGDRIYLKHPSATASTSGNWHEGTRSLYVWSPNTPFPPEEGLSAFSVFCIMEAAGEIETAARKLRELGYGDDGRDWQKEATREKKKLVEGINPVDKKDETLLEDIDKTLEEAYKVIKEGYGAGIGIGIGKIDRHFVHKKGDLVMINGFESTGKTTILFWIAVQQSKKNGQRFVIATKENENAKVVRRLMEFYLEKERTEWTDQEEQRAFNFINAYFRFIRQDVSHTFLEMLSEAEAIAESWPFDVLLADPYNAFPRRSKMSSHDYDQEVINEAKIWKRRTRISLWVTIHPPSAKGREGGNKGNTAPSQYDAEGGSKWANACDFWLTWHRDTQADEDRNVGQLYIRKVREEESGGRTTPRTQPILLAFQYVTYKCLNDFEEDYRLAPPEIDPKDSYYNPEDYKDFDFSEPEEEAPFS